MWICLFFLTEDMGMALGYGISSCFAAFNISWTYGFYIQGLSMAAVAGMFSIVPTEFYSHDHEALVELNEGVKRKIEGS
jgi:hypothetical protein